jgi:hypothetical protein
MEIWKEIEGYESSYQVSNKGNIRSLDRYRYNINGTMLVKGKVLKQNKHTKGYLKVMLQDRGIAKRYFVHRLVAKAFIGDSGNLQVNHKDGNKTNNNIDNLEYVTCKENIRHYRESF